LRTYNCSLHQSLTMAAPSAPDEYEVQEQAGGYRYPESSPVRFPAWVGLLIFSAIALIASLTLGHPMDGPLKWTIVLTTLSTVFAIVSVFGYLFSRGIFMGQLPETVLVRKDTTACTVRKIERYRWNSMSLIKLNTHLLVCREVSSLYYGVWDCPPL
jgi:hypothetical protein